MFALEITVSPETINYMKAYLTQALPHVKSSHRCEALARGLEFRTYASMLAAARSVGTTKATAKGDLFRNYLSEHSFNEPIKYFYFAVGKVAMASVIEREPNLTHWGYRVGERKRNDQGQRETPSEYSARLVEEQKNLFDDGAIEEFLQALAFLSTLKPAKTISTAAHSYSLKHLAERSRCSYPTGDPIEKSYVANGSLIAAAIYSGFRYRTFKEPWGYSLNVTFNMSKSEIRKLDDEFLRLRNAA